MSRVTLYRQKKDGKKLPTWWLYYRKDGKTFRESTDTTNLEDAEKARNQIEKLLTFDRRAELTEGFYRATRNLDIQEVGIKQFFENVRATVTVSSTLREYKKIDEQFISFLASNFPKLRLLHEIHPTHIETWHQALAQRLYARTVNKRVKVIRMAFKKAVKNGILIRNPTENIELLKVGESARRPFTTEELKLICSKAEGFFRYSAAIALYTAARLGDICLLKWRDIDWKQGCINYRMQKRRGKIMEVPIHPALRTILTELAGNKKPDMNEYLFPKQAEAYIKSGSAPISAKWLDFLGTLKLIQHNRYFYDKRVRDRRAGKTVSPIKRKPGELSFHSFRHTAISMLKNIGAPQAVAMQIAGHESASISKIYTHLDESAERKWIEALPDFTQE